jgi:hypothetical protein
VKMWENSHDEWERNTMDLSSFEEVPIYGVSRKGTKETTCTIGRHNSTVRKLQLFLGIIQASFFAGCALIWNDRSSPESVFDRAK